MTDRPPIPTGVILVVRTQDRDLARVACLGAIQGGVDAVEVTLSVPGANELVAELSEACPEGTRVGVGTVIAPETVGPAVDSGANFVVSPNTNQEVMRAAHDLGVPVIPGALTPTEIEFAHRLGADAVKIFPVGSVGGPRYIREIRGPLSHIPLVVSGGVTRAQVAEYLQVGAAAACVGRDMFPAEMLAARHLEQLAAHARNFMSDVRG